MKKLFTLLVLIGAIGTSTIAQNGGSKETSAQTPILKQNDFKIQKEWEPRFAMGINFTKTEEWRVSTDIRLSKRWYVKNLITTNYVDKVFTYRNVVDDLKLRYIWSHSESIRLYSSFGVRWSGDFYPEGKAWIPWDNDFWWMYTWVGMEAFPPALHPLAFSMEFNSRQLGDFYPAIGVSYYFNKKPRTLK